MDYGDVSPHYPTSDVESVSVCVVSACLCAQILHFSVEYPVPILHSLILPFSHAESYQWGRE